MLTHLAGSRWEADYTIPAHTRTISLHDAGQLKYDGDDDVDNAIQCCSTLAAAPLKKTVHLLATEEPYQLLYTLEFCYYYGVTTDVIVSQCISYLEFMHAWSRP